MPRYAAPPLLLAGVLLAGACAQGPEAPPPAAPSLPPAVAAIEARPTLPPAVIVAGAMPGDVQLYAELTSISGLLAAERGILGADAVATFLGELARETGIDPQLEGRAVAAIASIHLGARKAGDAVKVAASAVLTDAQPVRDLIAAGALVEGEAYGPYGRRLEKGGATRRPKGEDRIVWFDAPRLLVIGDEPMVRGVADVVEGRAPGLSDAQRAAAPPVERPQAWGFVAPAMLDGIAKGLSFPAPLAVAYGLQEGGLRGAYRGAIAVRDVPPYLSPRALALARRLPVETIGYLALSTGVPGGRAGAQLLTTQIEAIGGPEIQTLDAGLAVLTGLRLADIAGALGGEGVAAVVVRPGITKEAEVQKGYAFVVLQEIAEPGPAEALLALARDKLAALGKKARVHAEGTGFSAELLADAPVPFVRAKLSGGRLFFGLGQRDLVERAAQAADKGKGTLGDDGAHARAVSALPANAGARLWLDLGRMVEIAAASAPPAERAPFELLRGVSRGPGRLTSALSLSAVPEGDRVRVELDELNGVGVFAALGIFGVRRYLTSAKTAEARNTIGAITRAAVASYERETLGPGGTISHALCGSALPVPAEVPHGTKYAPSGKDFSTGDAEHGWQCLKFAMTEPFYYRYSYSAGGPYKGPARGGPDPGPDGFEIAAEGDLDGNGVTSLFTRTGRVDKKRGQVVVSTDLFVDKEHE